MQLAGSYAEPSTDVIDDSLSRLLMKERGGIPTPAKKDVTTKKPPQPQPRPKKETEEDKDLLASMANRLQKLEKTNQSQRLEIKVLIFVNSVTKIANIKNKNRKCFLKSNERRFKQGL